MAVSMEDVMFRNFAVVVGYAAILVLFTAASVPAAQFGTAEEANSHVGPSGSPENLLNSDYLLIASDDSLAHQQIFRP